MTAALPPLRFAAVGLDHRHIYDQVQSLLDVGAQCVGYWTQGTPKTLEGFASASRTSRAWTTAAACSTTRRSR